MKQLATSGGAPSESKGPLKVFSEYLNTIYSWCPQQKILDPPLKTGLLSNILYHCRFQKETILYIHFMKSSDLEVISKFTCFHR